MGRVGRARQAVGLEYSASLMVAGSVGAPWRALPGFPPRAASTVTSTGLENANTTAIGRAPEGARGSGHSRENFQRCHR